MEVLALGSGRLQWPFGRVRPPESLLSMRLCLPAAVSGVSPPGGGHSSPSPGDHYNCPIGSYTHNLPLPESCASGLDDARSLMSSAGYIRMEEIPNIHRLPGSPGVVIY